MTELLPFDTLPEEKEPVIAIPLRIFNSVAQETRQKIEPCYDKAAQELTIPRKFGLLVGERLEIKNALNTQREISGDIASLVLAVSEETGRSIQEIASLVDNPYDELSLFKNHLDKLISIQEKQSSVSFDSAAVTTILRHRVCKQWTIDDTNALNERIFDAIVDFIAKERTGWEETEQFDMGKQAEAPSLNGSTPSNSQSQTGEESTKKLEEAESTTTDLVLEPSLSSPIG